jgi:Uncharacterized protein conserved in bacteria (DUF2188)
VTRHGTALLHVEPASRGRWTVRREGDAEPVSEHADAAEATEAAVERAGAEGAPTVLVRDLYARVHRHGVKAGRPDPAPLSRSGPSRRS